MDRHALHTHCLLFFCLSPPRLTHTGCLKKGYDKEEMMVANCTLGMTSLIDFSPDFAKVRNLTSIHLLFPHPIHLSSSHLLSFVQLFYQLTKLPTKRKEEVFDRVSKRLKASNVWDCVCLYVSWWWWCLVLVHRERLRATTEQVVFFFVVVVVVGGGGEGEIKGGGDDDGWWYTVDTTIRQS